LKVQGIDLSLCAIAFQSARSPDPAIVPPILPDKP
jgi:hypothetical protein